MSDIRYLAGLYVLVNKQWHNEVQGILENIRISPGYYGLAYRKEFPYALPRLLRNYKEKLCEFRQSRVLAKSPDFSASFDDPKFGSAWRAHAKAIAEAEKAKGIVRIKTSKRKSKRAQ